MKCLKCSYLYSGKSNSRYEDHDVRMAIGYLHSINKYNITIFADCPTCGEYVGTDVRFNIDVKFIDGFKFDSTNYKNEDAIKLDNSYYEEWKNKVL